MKTWVIARGPDKQKVLQQAQEVAEQLRKGEGVIMVCDAGNNHIDSIPDRSVTVVALQDDSYHIHVVDERKTQFMVLAVGLQSEAQAVRMSQGMQELGSVAVITKNGTRLFPEDAKLEECRTVIIEYPSKDAEIVSMTFDSEAYYGWLSSKKLSGRKLVL